jgi:NADPH:quinone reductase-like Zn-dependent oxidoreductase
MKAIVARAPGGLDQLEYTDWPDPVAGPGEVIVKVGATACNHADVWLRRGMLGPLPMVPGIDAAGTIADIGPGVTGLPAGTRVLLNPATSCGHCPYCHAGEHGLCAERKALGQLMDGGFAQYVKIPWENVHPIRDDLSFEEAAAIPSAFFTAWQLLTRRADLRFGQTILVMASGSGVGSAAIQIARLLGARIIATAGSDAKLQRAREWGADALVNYSQDDWPRQVMDLTDGEGAHVILDTVGGAFWPGYFQCIRRGGKIVTFSFTSGKTPSVDIETIMRRQMSIIGSSPQGAKTIVEQVMALVNQGKLQGVVDRVFPLSEAARAQEAMEQRDVIGKIVLVPE